MSTGAPQGCVSSPVLFTLYTNECRSGNPNNYIIKFSDDTAILALLDKDSVLDDYFSEVQNFVNWCDDNHLVLNVKKTQEMVFDPKSIGDHRPVVIHDSTISQVPSYKYLGIWINNSLTWNTHVDSLCSKLQQRLHFLRRLRVHGVDQKFMLVFYRAVLESLVRFGITVWFGNLSVQLRSKLLRLVQTAGKIIGVSQLPSLQSIYEQATLKQAQKIVCDVTHVLNGEFVLLPSGRRYKEPKWKYIRFKRWFVPASTKMLNEALKQQ